MGLLAYSSYFLLQKPSSIKTPHIARKAYYFPIPTKQCNQTTLPYLPITIGQQKISILLDLGLEGGFALSKDILDTIPNKTYLATHVFSGIRGIPYEKKGYEIPTLQLGPIHFEHVPVFEEFEDFDKMSFFAEDGTTPPPQPSKGSVGWKAFKQSNLLLDLGHSLVSFADSFETLCQNGFGPTHFIKTPLLLDRGFVEIQTITDNQPLRWILDTGASVNLIQAEPKEGQTQEEAIWDPTNFLVNIPFSIEGVEFDSIACHRAHLPQDCNINAILGMPFFKDHVIFIDFANNFVYIAKSPYKIP